MNDTIPMKPLPALSEVVDYFNSFHSHDPPASSYHPTVELIDRGPSHLSTRLGIERWVCVENRFERGTSYIYSSETTAHGSTPAEALLIHMLQSYAGDGQWSCGRSIRTFQEHGGRKTAVTEAAHPGWFFLIWGRALWQVDENGVASQFAFGPEDATRTPMDVADIGSCLVLARNPCYLLVDVNRALESRVRGWLDPEAPMIPEHPSEPWESELERLGLLYGYESEHQTHGTPVMSLDGEPHVNLSTKASCSRSDFKLWSEYPFSDGVMRALSDLVAKQERLNVDLELMRQAERTNREHREAARTGRELAIRDPHAEPPKFMRRVPPAALPCPDCDGTGEVVNFVVPTPCPRGCARPEPPDPIEVDQTALCMTHSDREGSKR